ncbi:MAG: NAD(P)/FAD-dependent oxidoreductase [Ruminococcus sp.]|nr:NAD(P)/FAD-dependent oxidoreductase [Ruminococcus sp.]
MTFDAVIIGGGAAGLFCAVQLGWQGKSCAVIEHSDRCGKKLRITGKGRCNVTNNCDVETVMNNIPRNSKFLFSALSRFTPEDTMSFFECLGVELKTERGNRVFPVSDRAEEIVNALVNAAEQSGTIIISDNARELIFKDGAVCGVKCDKGEYYSENVIVATGGKSYPKTGSTGDGYRFAKSAGHRVTAITPSLCPIVTAEREECAEAMGLSLRNCTLALREGENPKPVYKEQGEMLFTHFGLSGPLVLSASAHLGNLNKSRYFLDIDLKPALSEEQLDLRILRDWGEFPNRDFGNSLGRLLPAKLIPVIVKRSGIAGEKKVNQITRGERERLVHTMKKLTYTVKKMRPVDEAIITRGGVETSEIDPKTMRSKLCRGLYFIGEVLDVDGYTGGFNLQIAFATANAAAQALGG